MSARSLVELIYAWRVRTGTILVIFILLLAAPTWKSLFAGLATALLGLLLRTWASGHLRKEKELTVSGPYQYTRNPLYLGNLLIGAGIAVAASSWGVTILLIVYFLVFYPVIIRKEKERMAQLFPEKYRAYRSLVPLFLPSFRRAQDGENHLFSWRLYTKNKEYRAVAGTGILWILLAGRMLLFP